MSGGAITIGRRIGSEEMPAALWRQFTRDVGRLVTRSGGTVYLVAFGSGTWGDLAEEAAVITFDGANPDLVAAELPWLAWLYGQEAIALVTGLAVLVGQADASALQAPTSWYQEAEGLRA